MKPTEAEFLKRGRKFLEKKDYSRAVLEFNNAIKANAKDPEPHYQLGLAYLAQGDLNGGVAAMLKATALDPKYAPAQLKVAELMATYSRDNGILNEAKQRVEGVAGDSPQSADAQNALALADFGLGKSEIAAQRLEEVLQRLPGDLKTSINLAKLKMSAGDKDGAAEVLKKAAAQAPKSADHALVLGQFYVQTGRLADAEVQFKRTLELDPKQGVALYLLGQVQSERGRADEAEKTFRQVSALPERDYKPAHAIFLFTHGRRPEAIREFEQLRKNDPKDRSTSVRLVSAYGLTGRMTDAERVLDEQLRKNPNDVDALEQKAKVCLALGEVKEAQAALQQHLHFKPDSANGHYLMAEVHKARGSWSLERQELQKAVELDPKNLSARLELSRALLGVPDTALSLRVLDQAPEEQKKLSSWVAQRNWVLFAMSDYAGMRKGIETGLGMQRTRDLLLQDALLKLNDGNIPGARAEMEDILKDNPENIQVLETLASSYATRGDISGAVGRLRQAAAGRPKSAPLQLLLGNWLQQSGDVAGARAAFLAAGSADPKLATAGLALAELDLREKKLDEARRTLTPWLDSSDNRVNLQAHLLAGGLEASAGNPEAAIVHFRKVLEQNPSHVVALDHLATLLADNETQLDEALQLAQKAVELSPTDPLVEDALGWILYRKGMYPSALKHLEFASAPSSRWRHKFHLAMVYLKLGDRERGNRILSAAMKQNPDLMNALSGAESSAMGEAATRF
jgi:tetratricopeptide (TPR) repeat protein